MLVTPSGIVMLVRLMQPEKAQAPMLVTPSGMVILVRLLQLVKAASGMLVTLSGIVMLFRLLQKRKAAHPMLVTGLPSIVSGMTSSPVAASSQSVMVTSPLVVVHVRSLRSAADRGRTAKRERARVPVRCFMLPVIIISLQEVEALDPAPDPFYMNRVW